MALLIELGVDIDEPHNANLITALHVAAACGKTDYVQALAAAGALLESRDNQGWTPLMFAAQEGFSDVVDALISAGADVNAKDEMNRTGLMQAARCDQLDIARRLLADGADPNAASLCGTVITPLIVAATSGVDETIRVLLDAGADVNFLDLQEGYNALMMASIQGHAATVRLLLEREALVDQETEFRVTAVTMARRGSHADVEAILRDAGAGEPDAVPLPIWFPFGSVGDPLSIASLKRPPEPDDET